MESIPVLHPLAVAAVTVEVVAAAFLPVTPQIRFLCLESRVVKVVVEVEDFGNLHCIQEFVTASFCQESGNPIARPESCSLMIGRAHSKCAAAPERIRG